MHNINSISQFTDKEFYDVLNDKLPKCTKDKVSTLQPVAHILGGQAGAGKSRLNAMFENENTIVINGDKYRSYHPRSRELDMLLGKDSLSYKGAFSGRMVEALVDSLSKNEQYNLVIEGTLRTAEVPLKTARLLKSRGYEVNLDVMATKPEISYLSTILRYEKALKIAPNIARYIPKSTHDKILDSIPDNLKEISQSKVFDHINLWTRYLELRHHSENQDNSIYDAFNNEVYGKWTNQDIKELEEIKKALKDIAGGSLSDIKCKYDIPSDVFMPKGSKLKN